MPNLSSRMAPASRSKRGILGILRELLTYSSKLKVPMAVALSFAAVGAVLTIIGPSFLSQITDLIESTLGGEIDLGAIGRVGIILLAIYGLSFVFTYVEHYIMATVTLDLSRNLRQDLSRKINRVPMSYFNTVSHGDILSRVTNDVSTLQQALANSLPSIISAAAQFVGCLVMMFVTEWRMALAAAEGAAECARFARDEVLPAMNACRALADRLESVMSASDYPMPGYAELMWTH